MNIQIDLRVMTRGYQKFQISLVNGRYRFVGRLRRFKSRRLYRADRKYVEHCNYSHGVSRRLRTSTNTSYEEMSLFVSLTLFLGGFGRDFWAARLRPICVAFGSGFTPIR